MDDFDEYNRDDLDGDGEFDVIYLDILEDEKGETGGITDNL
jgi:hypothetical protein